MDVLKFAEASALAFLGQFIHVMFALSKTRKLAESARADFDTKKFFSAELPGIAATFAFCIGLGICYTELVAKAPFLEGLFLCLTFIIGIAGSAFVFSFAGSTVPKLLKMAKEKAGVADDIAPDAVSNNINDFKKVP